mmetsp:Transcript_8629/g.18875  ORF Transcript_8629/g.18875 Transcript_8629/m.18875 type:complete len:584 (+) Transcript_8629:64-1815(+)
MREVSSAPVFSTISDSNVDEDEGRRSSRVAVSLSAVVDRVRGYRKRIFIVSLSLGVIFGFMALVGLLKVSTPSGEFADLICGQRRFNLKEIQHYSKKSENLIAVNFGGWLCLEDWFFSGAVGRYVSTPNVLKRGQGACLPPLVSGPLDKPWASEGGLVAELERKHGSDFAAQALKAHRESYINETDFKQLKTLGIKSVRIPLTWAMFADALKDLAPELYGKHNPETDTVIVPDPYYVHEIKYATVPRQWLKERLLDASAQDLEVVLDLHTMPGGSSDGTYSGVWPLQPVFWYENAKVGTRNISLQEVGIMLNVALIKWVESLGDLLAKGTIRGVALINEPGHLSAFAGHSWCTEKDVLDFVDKYADLFRKSSLPSRGVRLYVQLIETAFDQFNKTVPDWYHRSFSAEERSTWAVMARHFYTAWNGHCNGLIEAGGAFQCDAPMGQIKEILDKCVTSYAKGFIKLFPSDLRAVTEWSLGTHYDANMACTRADVLREVFEAHVNGFALLNDRLIEPFFWTWRMPFAPKFEPGWSLKFFSGFSGQEIYSDGRCVVGDWASESPLKHLALLDAAAVWPPNSSSESVV